MIESSSFPIITTKLKNKKKELYKTEKKKEKGMKQKEEEQDHMKKGMLRASLREAMASREEATG